MNQSLQKKILITGSLGHVGSQVIPFLKDTFALRLTDIREGEIAGIPVVPLDLSDPKKIPEVFSGVDAIVHMATANYKGVDDDSPEEVQAAYRQRLLSVNIHGTYNVYETARILKIPKVVYISSITVVMGTQPNDYHTDQPPAPSNFYAATKLFGENTAYVYWKRYGIRSHVLRLGQPYPIGNSKELTWEQNPNTVSYFATFADTARAVTASLNSEEPPFGIYNIFSKHRTVYRDYSAGEEIGFIPQDYPEDIIAARHAATAE